MILLNLNLHWWARDEFPWPRPAIIADRAGVSKRTVERALQRLEKKGFIERLAPERLESGRMVRRINLAGLVGKLNDASERSVAANEYRRRQSETHE